MSQQLPYNPSYNPEQPLPPAYPGQPFPPQPQGYPPQGYPPQGYPPQGYPPQGYPPPSYQQPQTQQQATNVVVVGQPSTHTQTVVVHDDKPNHVLHCIITFFCPWWIVVWICCCILHGC